MGSRRHVPIMTKMRGMKMLSLLMVFVMVLGTGVAFADIPGDRPGPRGAMPNPGTQEQELANITFPAPYNVFEFVVTCGACHGGTIDQQAGHFGNWAGTNMASSARDPFFRANELIVNDQVKQLTGEDGAGNLCFRCHSPNGWYSGRFNPSLAGDAEGGLMEHSILASTDDEGILCEMCHRTIGSVTMNEVGGADASDEPAFETLSSVNDTRMAGGPSGGEYPYGPATGNPLGDATLQINDGMTYGGKYPGSVDIYYSDEPLAGTNYTGQTYGVYPDYWTTMGLPDIGVRPIGAPELNESGQRIVYNPDGSVPLHFEVPADVPKDEGTGYPDFQAQAISLEHPTFDGEFIRSSEFCGSCHDLTVPLVTGMPEQRTYTEWAYSDFGDEGSEDFARCQDCHMPSMLHEYADDAPVTLNPDPVLAGFFPYGKDRASQGGTAFHKFAGANRDLPEMMSILYPEVDLEVIGAPTGRDTRIFPGMMSDRSLTWDRAKRNTELSLRESMSVDILGVTETAPGEYEAQIQVTNNTGHKVPSGYPDGRRVWVEFQAMDATGNVLYESGVYDEATAMLTAGNGVNEFARATTTTIDASDNRVMVYEKITGSDPESDGTFETSPALLNSDIVFDNRIPPQGWDPAGYAEAGVYFWNYTEAPTGVIPFQDDDRFAAGENWDTITYKFTAEPGLDIEARAELEMQTHSRDFVEYLKDNQPADTPRPQGPPSVYSLNYPLDPTYLSDVIGLDGMTDLDGQQLADNWGGIAYAAWMMTGKGAPFQMDTASTTALTVPDAPINVTAAAADPFSIQVDWDAVDGAEGYEVWVRYGVSDATASWDPLVTLPASETSYLNDGLNVGKTYGYKVLAFNGEGNSPFSEAVTAMTPTDLPLMPEALRVVGTTAYTVTLSWFDMADNETSFVIQRQDVPATADFQTIATIPSQTAGGATGGNVWVDTTVQPDSAYNYRIAALNDIGMSIWTVPVMAATLATPGQPGGFTATATAADTIELAWTAALGTVDGYRIERATDVNGPFAPITTVNAATLSFTDTPVTGNTTYYYKLYAYNTAGDSVAALANATTPTDTADRLAGVNRYATAISVMQEAFPNWTGVTEVIIASGETKSQSDALAASGLVGAYNGPLLLVRSNRVPAETRDALIAMPDGINIRVVGGPAAVQDSVLTELRAIPGVNAVERIPWGADRYETAAYVAVRMKDVLGDAFPTTALVANGANQSNFYDALAASPVSVSTHYPILLVARNSVPAATTDAMGSLGITRSYIIGGTAAVSNTVANTLNVAAADRIAGSTRYATAVAVAERAGVEGWLGFADIGVASGIPDALTGGSMIGLLDGPILLTDDKTLSPETAAFITVHKTDITKVYVFGGTGVIDDAVITTIDQLLQ